MAFIEGSNNNYPAGYPGKAIRIREAFCNRRYNRRNLPGEWKDALFITTKLKGVMENPNSDPDGLIIENLLRQVQRFNVKTGTFIDEPQPDKRLTSS